MKHTHTHTHTHMHTYTGEREDDDAARPGSTWRGVDDEEMEREGERDTHGGRQEEEEEREAEDEVGELPGELTDEQRYLLAALGEVPPEFAIPEPAQRPQWQGDQVRIFGLL